MTNLEWSWQEAAIAACGLVVVTILLRLARRRRLTSAAMFTQETALVLVLFGLWQFAGSFSVMGPGGALGRGRWIWHLERVMHLPNETSVDRRGASPPAAPTGCSSRPSTCTTTCCTSRS